MAGKEWNAQNKVLRAGALERPWGMRDVVGVGGGVQDRGHVQPWLIHVNVRQKPLQYCKVITLQLKLMN